MAYGTTSGVSALLPAIGALGATSTPTASQVTDWLDEGASIIDRTLANAGYTVPVLNAAIVYAELTALNNLYGAAYAMIARGMDTVQGSEENRAQVWLDRFYSQLAAIAASTLADIPIAPSAATATAGRRVRFTQLKKIDGYSAPHDDDTEMDS